MPVRAVFFGEAIRKGQREKMEEKKKYGLFSNVIFIIKEMFYYEKSSKITLPGIIVTRLFITSLAVALPAVVVGALEEGVTIETFLLRLGMILFIYIIAEIANTIALNLYSASGTIVRVYHFHGKLIEKCLDMDYCNRESNKNQKLFGGAESAVSESYGGIELVMRRVPEVCVSFIGMFLFGGAILTVDGRILLVLLLMLVCNLLTNRFARNYLNSHMEENTEIARKSGYLQEQISELNYGKDIRMYQMEQWLCRILKGYLEKGQEWQKGVEKHFYLPVASDTIFIALRDALAYIILIYQAVRGEISIAQFTLMIGVVGNFSGWMFGFVNAGTDVMSANKLVSLFREALDVKDSFLHGEGRKLTEEELKNPPEIEFRNVSFSYEAEECPKCSDIPSKPVASYEKGKKEVLSHLSFTIHVGERLALVGGNGAGKTTLVKLLCGFYHVTEGEILVNGVPVEEYDIEEYFKLIGVVFQDIDPLELSLVNVVTGLRKEQADMERFWQAVKLTGLYEKIQKLPDKEDTYIKPVFHKNGIQLSGGENQKLMMARCIYKNAPFLILDEPTSALDPLAESEIYENYNRMAENKTSIFISHRLASTRFCDKILFLEHGRIIEEGTHEELMARGGRYAHIFEVQSHYYRESKGMEEAYESDEK